MTSNDLEIAVARRLYAAFNEPPVDGVMEHFSDAAVYDDPMGGRHAGKAAVAAALAPAFSGAQRYTLGELIHANGVVVATWVLETGPTGGRVRLEDMDILRFSGRKIELKQCFMKAASLLVRPAGDVDATGRRPSDLCKARPQGAPGEGNH